MKSERRHELQTNELAQRLSVFLEKVQPYWRALVGGVIVLLTVFFAFGFVSASQRRARERGWAQYLDAKAERNLDRLRSVADSNRGDTVGVWARYSAAQAQLTDATTQLHQDRETARQGLSDAVEGFQTVLSQTVDPLLRQRATWGLGQAYESLEELGKAREQYDLLAETWPDSALAKQAEQRSRALSDPRTREFYQWFYAQNPPARPAASAGGGPTTPFELPEEPDFSVPDPADGDLDAESAAEAEGANPLDVTEEGLPGLDLNVPDPAETDLDLDVTVPDPADGDLDLTPPTLDEEADDN